MADASSELVTYIRQIGDQTRQGRMIWTKANPSTYSWLANAPTPARITLQRVEGPKVRRDPRSGRVELAATAGHVLQAQDIKTGATHLTIDGSENSELEPLLEDLFNTITEVITKKGVDFLGSILPRS